MYIRIEKSYRGSKGPHVPVNEISNMIGISEGAVKDCRLSIYRATSRPRIPQIHPASILATNTPKVNLSMHFMRFMDFLSTSIHEPSNPPSL